MLRPIRHGYVGSGQGWASSAVKGKKRKLRGIARRVIYEHERESYRRRRPSEVGARMSMPADRRTRTRTRTLSSGACCLILSTTSSPSLGSTWTVGACRAPSATATSGLDKAGLHCCCPCLRRQLAAPVHSADGFANIFKLGLRLPSVWHAITTEGSVSAAAAARSDPVTVESCVVGVYLDLGEPGLELRFTYAGSSYRKRITKLGERESYGVAAPSPSGAAEPSGAKTNRVSLPRSQPRPVYADTSRARTRWRSASRRAERISEQCEWPEMLA